MNKCMACLGHKEKRLETTELEEDSSLQDELLQLCMLMW